MLSFHTSKHLDNRQHHASPHNMACDALKDLAGEEGKQPSCGTSTRAEAEHPEVIAKSQRWKAMWARARDVQTKGCKTAQPASNGDQNSRPTSLASNTAKGHKRKRTPRKARPSQAREKEAAISNVCGARDEDDNEEPRPKSMKIRRDSSPTASQGDEAGPNRTLDPLGHAIMRGTSIKSEMPTLADFQDIGNGVDIAHMSSDENLRRDKQTAVQSVKIEVENTGASPRPAPEVRRAANLSNVKQAILSAPHDRQSVEARDEQTVTQSTAQRNPALKLEETEVGAIVPREPDTDDCMIVDPTSETAANASVAEPSDKQQSEED